MRTALRCSTNAMDYAAMYGHLEIVKWLHENRTEGCTTNAMDSARTLKMVKSLHANRAEGCTTGAMDWVQWFLATSTLFGCFNRSAADCYTRVLSHAAGLGRFDVVQWIYRNLRSGCRSPRTTEEDAVGQAAGSGHFEIIQWLHTHYNGARRRPRYDISEAAVQNRFKIVKWLVEHSDQAQDTNDLNFALESGNLEMVVWPSK